MSLQQAINHTTGKQDRIGVPTNTLADVMIGDSENIAGRGVGKAKNNLDAALKDFEKAKSAIFKASDEMQEKTESLSRRAKEAVSRAKDASAQMADSMNKITKVLGPDFEKRLVQLDQLTCCMERLVELNNSGRLIAVLDALRKT